MERRLDGGAPAPPPPWRDLYEPHWIWLAGSLVIPAALLVFSVLGLGRGAFISSDVAGAFPLVALVLSLALACAALLRGRRVPLAITCVGLMLTLIGFWWLRWVS